MKTTTAALRHGLLGVLTAAALGGAATANLAAPSATGATDPCAASEMARTVGSVAKSAGDYLDSHPETNQVMTTAAARRTPISHVAQELLRSQSQGRQRYAENFGAADWPGDKCKLPISIPQALGLMQGAQGGLPAGLPGGGPPGQPVAGAPGSGPAGGAAAGNAPAPTGPLPGQATAPQTAVR